MADQSWNNAPRLMQIAASQQGGSRGAQVWGLTDKYDLVSTYQETPGGSWSPWSDPGWANAPGSLQQIAACQQNDGRCQLFATDSDQQLWTIWQTSPGGGLERLVRAGLERRAAVQPVAGVPAGRHARRPGLGHRRR